jgi:methionyl-tRNA formyltransferase
MNIQCKKIDKWVILIGGPRHRALLKLIEHNVPISLVIVPDNNNPKLKETLKICSDFSIPVQKLRREKISLDVQEIIDMPCLSLGFPYLFPQSFIEQTRFIVNVHGTLLPKYRGACTLNWVIENGEEDSGVTVHFVDVGCDTGDIILQRSFPISDFDTGQSLFKKTLEFEPSVVVEALQLLYRGNIDLTSQKNLECMQYPNRKPLHSELDPSQPLIKLYNKIRAADPDNYPAYFFINGEKVCIKLWRESKPPLEEGLL